MELVAAACGKQARRPCYDRRVTAPRDIHPRIADLVDAPLEREEFLARIEAPLREEEIQEATELYRWFTRRYPTAGERLAYARRKFEEWNRRLERVERHGREGPAE